jgi:hypothetical protein
MIINIHMSNGLLARYEIDEMLLDAVVDPVGFAISQVTPAIEECIARRREEAPDL